jgi:hypothetical protein
LTIPIPIQLSHAELVVAAVPASLEAHRTRTLAELHHVASLEPIQLITTKPTEKINMPVAPANKPTKAPLPLTRASVLVPSAPQEAKSSSAPALTVQFPDKLTVAQEAPASILASNEMIISEQGNEVELAYVTTEEQPLTVINPDLALELQTTPTSEVTFHSFKESVESNFGAAPELFAEDSTMNELKDSISTALEALTPDEEIAIQNEYMAVQGTIAELLAQLPDVMGLEIGDNQDILPTATAELSVELVETLLIQCEAILRLLGLPAEESDVQNLLRITAPPELLSVLFALEPMCPVYEINPENKVSYTVLTDDFTSRVAQRERYIVALGRKILTLHPTRLQTPLHYAA